MRLALTLTVLQDLSDPTSKNSAGAADVVTLGDAWLAQAIRDRLVQPIANAESYRCVCVSALLCWENLLVLYPPDILQQVKLWCERTQPICVCK